MNKRQFKKYGEKKKLFRRLNNIKKASKIITDQIIETLNLIEEIKK